MIALMQFNEHFKNGAKMCKQHANLNEFQSEYFFLATLVVDVHKYQTGYSRKTLIMIAEIKYGGTFKSMQYTNKTQFSTCVYKTCGA